MKQQQSGVSAMLKQKLAVGEGVSHKDLLAICEVITFNGAVLAKLATRVEQLEAAIQVQPEPVKESPEVPKELEEFTLLFMGLPTKALH